MYQEAICQQVIIMIIIMLAFYVTIKQNMSKGCIFEKYDNNSKCTKEMKLLGPDRWPEECDKENFTNTVKDIYGFNNITNKIQDSSNEKRYELPEGTKLNDNDVKDLISGDFNQLLYQGKGYPKYEKVENPNFNNYWDEFGEKSEQLTENFCVNPPNVRGDSNKCKTSIENLENQSVRTFEHYTNRLKEPVNFNTYKVLANHAGITDNDLLPHNYGTLQGTYLDRFKHIPPLSDMDPQYEIPYDYKKEGFKAKKNNYNEYLRETFVDNKVKNNHKQFVEHLKAKNISGNKTKEHAVLSADSNICGSVLARDCFSNLGSCGGSSYGTGIGSGEAFIQHKAFCQNYCKPVEHCFDLNKN